MVFLLCDIEGDKLFLVNDKPSNFPADTHLFYCHVFSTLLWLLTVIIADSANGPACVKQHLLVCAFQKLYQDWHQASFYAGGLHFLCRQKRNRLDSPTVLIV